MADRRRKKNDIEEAKKAGQKALEDAKAGKIQRVESENEVRGFAEIPYLQGGNSNFGDTSPSVAIDTPTLPTVQQIADISRQLQEQNASRNEQRRAERDRIASLPVKKESTSVSMEQAMAGLQGANVANGTLDRRGALSENGQKEVNKLTKRIESLQRTPMTGDAAIDEVTQSNNQSEIADLQRQIDSIYETDNSERSANVDRYLDSNRKLSKYEKNEANAIFEEYLNNNPKAKELYNTNDAAMSSLLAQRFTPDEAEEYAKMITLKNKISRGQSAGLHATESMPFVKGLADKSTEKYGERIGKDLSDYDYSSQLEQTQTQNPLASMGGNMAYQLGSYAAFAPLLEGVPVVGKAAEKVGSLFSNPAVGEAAANIVRGQAADTILDTLPNEVLPDIMEGNWRDLPKDILLNQAGNLAFNLGGEAVGALANRVIPYLRNADEVADAVKQNEIDPATLAKQNEIDVNEKVDNVNQAVDEINNLAEQIPETPIVSPVEQITDAISKDDFQPLTFTIGNNTYIISRSTRDGEKWQLSHIDDTGSFTGHSAYKNDDELLSALRDADNIENLNLNGDMPTILDAPTITVGEMLNDPDAYSFEDFERAMRTFDINAETSDATKEDIIDFFMSEIEEYPDVANTPVKMANSFTPPGVNAADEVTDGIENLSMQEPKISEPSYDFSNDYKQLTERMANGETPTDTVETTLLNDPDIYSSHTPEQLKIMRDYLDSTDEGLADFIRTTRAGKYANPNNGYVINKTDDKVAAAINDVLGKDTSGYDLVLQEKGLKHLDKDHGANGGSDHSMADEATLARIQYVLENFDGYEKGKGTGMYKQPVPGKPGYTERADTILFYKKVDGNYYVVEAAPDAAAKENYIVAAYTDSSKINGDKHLPDVQAPGGTSETGALQSPNSTISQMDNSVKPNDDGPDLPPAGGGVPPTTPPTTPPDDGGNTPIELNQSANGDARERGMSQHVRGEDTPMRVSDVSDEVQADFVDNPDMYKQLKNADTQALADDIYNSGDQPISINGKVYQGDPETKFRTLLSEKNPASLPLGHQLAKDYSAAGNHDMAAQIYRDMGQALTESGQFSQASVLAMMKNDPLTALQYAQKQLDAINQQGAKRFGDKWKDLSLTDDEIQAFNSIEPGNTDAIKALYDKIGARLGKEYPTTFMEKLLEGRKVAMLFNVRTNVRNVGANIPTLGMRWVSDRVAALGEGLAHIINPDFARTQAVTGSGIQGRKIANEIFNSDKVQSLIKGQSGKYEIPELKNSLMNDRQMFKGTPVSKWINKLTKGGIEKVNSKLFGKEGVESGLETIRNATYKMLDLGDSPFVKENFVERLGSYIHANKIKSVDAVPDEAIQTAWEEAMKATYKDNSWAVQMLKGIRSGIEKIPGVGKPISQAVIPFLQAPGNIAARMVDYSPVNATKGIADIISGARQGSEQAVRRGIDEVAKGLTGSGMIILGMKLRESGLLTGDYSEDKDQRNFEKQNGFKPWALHIGDKYFTYDWAQPFAEPMIVGSLLQEAIDNSDQYDSDILNYFGIDNDMADTIIGASKEGLKASVNSWFNASPLQGLAELMSGDYSGNTDIAQNLFDVGVADFAGAFVPSLVNAVAKSNDITQRNTYDPSSQFATFLNQQAAKIPGLSDNLPAKYNTWGEEMRYAGSQGEAAAQRLVVPGEYGTDSNDSVDVEINRLFNDTADAKVFPWTAANKVGDRKLNNKEVSEYQENMGQRSRAIVEAFMNSSGYQNMDDASRVEALNTIYNTSKLITERDLFDKEIKDNSSYKKAVEAYDEGGAEGFVNFLQGKTLKDEANIASNSKIADVIQDAVDSGNIEQAQQIVDNTVTLQSLGLDKPGPAYAYEHAQGIIPGLTVQQFAETYKAMDADGNQGLKQSELIDYFNSNNINSIEGGRLWNAYGNSTWKKIPVYGDDGVWSLKSK